MLIYITVSSRYKTRIQIRIKNRTKFSRNNTWNFDYLSMKHVDLLFDRARVEMWKEVSIALCLHFKLANSAYTTFIDGIKYAWNHKYLHWTMWESNSSESKRENDAIQTDCLCSILVLGSGGWRTWSFTARYLRWGFRSPTGTNQCLLQRRNR